MKRSKHPCFLFVLYVLVVPSFAEDLTLNIDFDKPIFETDDKFLSLTVDPTTLLAGSALSGDFERSINLARAMAPGYIRLGGPGTSFRLTDPTTQDDKNKINVLSESDWILTHQWAKKTKLDVISCIRPDDRRDKIEDTEDTTGIISFGDHMAFNGSWQLGYECQTGCNIPAKDLARQTVNLRKVLNEFPRYSDSLVTGPDVVDYRSEKQRQYLRDYFDIAGPVLSAVTWHPNFASVTLDNEGAFIHQDDLEKDKEELLKVIGPFMDEQPLWIGESKPEEYKDLYIGALILARRLGNAAKSKISVLMRQPIDITQPSPDYWVSLLHKTLVGPKVFDTNTPPRDKNHVYLFCQCTKPSKLYEKGSITIFGVNLNPEEAVIDLKGTKINMVHEYVLSPGFDAPNRMFSERVFLNNHTLDLINNTVPELYPVILSDHEGLKLQLPPGGIGFWVLPHFKIKSCMEDDGTPKKEASLSFDGWEDSESAEDVKVQVIRSVQDRSGSETEKKRKIAPPVTRKSMLQKELRKLRKFTKKQLDDYEASKDPSKPEDSSTFEPEDTGSNPEKPLEPRNKLQEFKNRIVRIRSTPMVDRLKPRIDKVISQVTFLLNRVQNTLQSTKPEADRPNRMVPSSNARNHLKSLYDFLNRVNLNEPGNRNAKDQRTRLFKRDLYDAVEDRKWRNPPRKLSQGDDFVGKIVRPSVVELENSDSEEHAFYGFYKMDPVEGFPEGDVMFATGDLPEARNSQIMDPEDLAMEDEDDYPFYGPSDHFANSRTLKGKDRAGPRSFDEVWEAETFEPRKNVQFEDKFDVKSVPKVQGRSSNKWISYGRSKRKVYDLHTILDEEMIKEDDANSKDCKCRVIRNSGTCNCRSKRDSTNSAESATVSEVESLNSHDMADVEVFSELKEAPMERKGPANLEEASFASGNSRVLQPATPPTVSSNKNGQEKGSASFGEKRKEGKQIASLDLEAVPSEIIEDFNTEMPSLASSLALTPNEEGTQHKIITSSDEKLDKNENEEETMGVTTINLENSSSETLTSTPILSLTWNEDDQPLETPIQRDERTISGQKLDKNEGEEIPADAASTNLENFNSETPVSAPPLPLTSNEDVESPRSPRTPLRSQGSKFFLQKPRQNETEETTVAALQDLGNHSSNDWEISTPPTSMEATQQEDEESSSTTLKSATLWEQDIAEESEMDVDQTAVASSKRQVVDQQLPKPSRKPATDSMSRDSRRVRKQRQNPSNKKTKSNIVKAREAQLMQRAKVLSALAKMIRGKTGDEVYKFRSRSKSKDEAGEQEPRDKSRERRKMTFQKLRESVAEDINEMGETDGETRNLRRREVWEMIEDTDDFKDAMDCEKLACVLVYKPTKDDNNESYESIEKRNAPETEIVRAKNVRERIFDPKNQKNYRDSTILEHSNPHGTRTEILELKDLYEKEDDDEDDEDNNKTYFALVENLDKPRIFRLREKEHEGKRSVQILSPYSDFYDDYEYDQPRNRAYRTNLKNTNGREIYIIDPSEYRGGEPILKPYKGIEAIPRPSKSRANFRSKSLQEAIRKILRTQQKNRKTGRKRKGKSANEDELKSSVEELSENVNTGELLKTLIENLDLPSVEQLFKQLERYNTIEEKHHFIRSIVEEMRTRSEEDVGGATFESMENSKENESVQMLSAEEIMDYGEGKSVQSNEDDTTLEAVAQEHPPEESHARRRRDTTKKPKNDYSKWLKSLFLHETDPTIQKTRSNNKDNFNEGSSKILEILKKNEDRPDLLKMLPWTKKFNRFRREAVEEEEKMNESTDMVQPSEVLQHLEDSSSGKMQLPTEIDDIEKSLIEKTPIENFQKRNDAHGLPSLIQQSIPSLQNVVVDGLQKAKNFTGSVERLIENLDENFNETTSSEEERNWIDSKSTGATRNVFHNAIINVKKFFTLLGGITRILRG